MSTSLRCLAPLFLFLAAACDDAPDPQVGTCDAPAFSLPIYAPCRAPQGELELDPCDLGLTCSFGFCSEPCAEDNDCISWYGLQGQCGNGSCWYPCFDDRTCPDIGGTPTECEAVYWPNKNGFQTVCMHDHGCW